MLENDRRALARLPVAAQLDALQGILSQNRVLVGVLERAAAMDLPNWYLTAGGVVQTVWNVVTGRPPTKGIKDYDLFYFDDDTSWDAEDRAIRAGKDAFADLTPEVEIRNEARVHLWYAEHFGVPCPAFTSSEDAVDHFAATTCCVAVRLERDGRWRIYAPHGLADVFTLVVRPNPVLAPAAVYAAKAERWAREWPELTVMPWPVPPQ